MNKVLHLILNEAGKCRKNEHLCLMREDQCISINSIWEEDSNSHSGCWQKFIPFTEMTSEVVEKTREPELEDGA